MNKKVLIEPAKQLEFEFMGDPKFLKRSQEVHCSLRFDTSRGIDAINKMLSKIDVNHDPGQLTFEFSKDKPLMINGHIVDQICAPCRSSLLR